MQPLLSDDDDGHNLLLSTLTGGHGHFTAEAEVDEVEDWYDSDNDWQKVPLFDTHAVHGICSRILSVVSESSSSTPSTEQCGLTSSLLAMRL